MKLEIDIPKHQYNNIMALDSINLGRAPYKGIIMYAINAIKRGKALEQEPKPMVEIDLYSVIKQKYIEREVLDKISSEIEELYSYVEFDEDIKTSFNMVRLEEVQRVIDKYKAESEAVEDGKVD